MSLDDQSSRVSATTEAPALRYASSSKLAPAPAPLSTATVNPNFSSCATTSGVVATRISPSWTSFGMPILMDTLQRDSITVRRFPQCGLPPARSGILHHRGPPRPAAEDGGRFSPIRANALG
jgi:hypothetical protein